MSKSLDEHFKEILEAIQYNKELLEKCKNFEPPYDGIIMNGHFEGGENSKSYRVIYSTIIGLEYDLVNLVKAKNYNKNPIKYTNVPKNIDEHRCYSCIYISNIGSECICKNPKMTINEVMGELTSNCIMKFDSYQHHWLKINQDMLACRNFEENFKKKKCV